MDVWIGQTRDGLWWSEMFLFRPRRGLPCHLLPFQSAARSIARDWWKSKMEPILVLCTWICHKYLCQMYFICISYIYFICISHVLVFHILSLIVRLCFPVFPFSCTQMAHGAAQVDHVPQEMEEDEESLRDLWGVWLNLCITPVGDWITTLRRKKLSEWWRIDVVSRGFIDHFGSTVDLVRGWSQLLKPRCMRWNHVETTLKPKWP